MLTTFTTGDGDPTSMNPEFVRSVEQHDTNPRLSVVTFSDGEYVVVQGDVAMVTSKLNTASN